MQEFLRHNACINSKTAGFCAYEKTMSSDLKLRKISCFVFAMAPFPTVFSHRYNSLFLFIRLSFDRQQLHIIVKFGCAGRSEHHPFSVMIGFRFIVLPANGSGK